MACIGVVADIQYGDKQDGGVEGRKQLYREAADKAAAAVHAFQERNAAGVLNLGDIIDGNATPETTEEDFERVAQVFDSLLAARIPTWHVVGNHCVRAGRGRLEGRLGLPPACYYSTRVCPGWRLLVLDTTEMSPCSGYPADSPAMQECQAFLASHSPEQHVNLVPWNGGISSAQLRWLQGELDAADAAGDRVIVASHHPIGAGCARPTHMAWDAPALQQVLLDSKSFVLALHGHDHTGGYAAVGGRHFVTLEAILEAPVGSRAHAFLHLSDDKIVVEGHGTVTSRELALPALAASTTAAPAAAVAVL